MQQRQSNQTKNNYNSKSGFKQKCAGNNKKYGKKRGTTKAKMTIMPNKS